MFYKFITILSLVFFACITYSQSKFSAGAYVGGGIISANSPNRGAFATSVFIEAFLSSFDYFSTRLSFIYATDFNSIVPGNRSQYNPSVKGISLRGVYSYYLNYNFYIEQGLGLITLNDRLYSDRDNWDYGVIISSLAGIDLRKGPLNGFRIGIGMEFGLTFFNYSVQYYSIHFLAQYIF